MDEQGQGPNQAAGQGGREEHTGRPQDFVKGHSVGKDTRWVKGQSGNPAGRRKNSGSITTQLRKHLTHAKASKIAKELVRQAEGKGDNGTARDALAAAGIVLDRTDGPLNQVTVHRIEYRKVIILEAGSELPRTIEHEDVTDAEPVAALNSADASEAVRQITGDGIVEALPAPEVPEFEEVEPVAFMPRRQDGHRQIRAGDLEHRTDDDSGMTSVARSLFRGVGLPLDKPNKPNKPGEPEFKSDGL